MQQDDGDWLLAHPSEQARALAALTLRETRAAAIS
jgi:hypothetical protein